MILSSKYILTYSVGDNNKKVTVLVELKQVNGILKPKQNVYYGNITVNDKPYEYDLNNCVNALYGCQKVVSVVKEELINRYKKQGKEIKIISEKYE